LHLLQFIFIGYLKAGTELQVPDVEILTGLYSQEIELKYATAQRN